MSRVKNMRCSFFTRLFSGSGRCLDCRHLDALDRRLDCRHLDDTPHDCRHLGTLDSRHWGALDRRLDRRHLAALDCRHSGDRLSGKRHFGSAWHDCRRFGTLASGAGVSRSSRPLF